MTNSSRIFVAGHRGLVGSAICDSLANHGYTNLITRDRQHLDLFDTAAVDRFFEENRPQIVILAAAKVGGILANRDFPAEFIHQNLVLQNNVIHSSWRHGVERFFFLGSSCVYPKLAAQPISEDALLTGPLESTNDAYAIAKIAGIRMCQAYHRQYGFSAVSLMPTNLYGPRDNFDLQTSHVLPAILRKCHDAKLAGQSEITVWGSGRPRREFLHVTDLADACTFLLGKSDRDVVAASFEGILNIGCGHDVSIAELANLAMEVVGSKLQIRFDTTKPDGTPQKLLNVERMEHLGWRAKIPLREGMAQTYRWYSTSNSRASAK